jgi:predicted metal-dependent hydrolase
MVMAPQPSQLELFRLPPAGNAGEARHLLLSGRLVAYRLRRDRRRLSMRIDERGLHVNAPRSIALADIEAFVAGHREWVLAKLDELAGQVARRHLPVHDGARLPVLGSEVEVRVTSGNNRGLWQPSEPGGENRLWLAARPAADLAALARRALQRRAIEYFRPRLADTTARLGRPMPPLALSSARARWGSCSARSGIRLNWRLIHLPPAPIDYVIVHEAAHLVEMNHGPRFWATVERLYPDWQQARAELKRLGPGLPLI